MDQYTNNRQNDFLWTLLANPAEDAHLHAYNLQRLVNDFPQSGILQALLAHASDDKNLKQASAYFNARALYKLINAPSALIGVPDEKIIVQKGIGANGSTQYAAPQFIADAPVVAPAETTSEIVGEIPVEHHAEELAMPEIPVHNADIPPPIIEHETPPEIPAIIEQGINQPINEVLPDVHHLTVTPSEMPEVPLPVNEHEADLPFAEIPLEEHKAAILPEIPEMPPIPQPVADEAHDLNIHDQHMPEPPPVITEGVEPHEVLEEKKDGIEEPVHVVAAHEQYPEKNISDEVFDEIVGIESISLEHEAYQPETAVREEVEATAEKLEPEVANNDEAEKLIRGSMASTDFFSFDRAFGGQKPSESAENRQVAAQAPSGTSAPEIKEPLQADADHVDVSKYHDEKMPYTFMWWLDKTRKEHAGIYQPYIKTETANFNTRPKRGTDELQQQYFENIFHITSIEELDKNAPFQNTIPFDMKRKEQVIIERFIKEEPQIKPQSSDKIDNENKAKKSSEDRDELVTETLAAIYTDQMLYHKAIASYKKLMLKFPEKSRYFAGKIEQLEKKTN